MLENRGGGRDKVDKKVDFKRFGLKNWVRKETEPKRKEYYKVMRMYARENVESKEGSIKTFLFLFTIRVILLERRPRW